MSFSLFNIIERAKNLGSVPVANLAFAVLVDKALDLEKELCFIWEKAPGNEDADVYYDLLVISDGLRSSCIPAPLLRKPEIFRSLCKEEIEKHDHSRKIDPAIAEINDIKAELSALVRQILLIAPNAQELAAKYLAIGECQVCSFRAIGHNEGAIHCSIHPCGLPSSPCGDWDVDLEYHSFTQKVEWAKKIVVVRVEGSGESRHVYMPRQGMTFSDIPWESSNDYTLSKSDDGDFSVVRSNGSPQWVWYYVAQRLQTINFGESRWLIGKGCDHSSYYEVWAVKDPKAKPEPRSGKQPEQEDPGSFWKPLVLDYYKQSDNYIYSDIVEPQNRWGRTQGVVFTSITDTCKILQHLPRDSGDPFYDDRWLVWNIKARRHDVLYRIQ